MNQQREPDQADTTYRYLHHSPEELAQLPTDELLQACLQMRRMLDIIMGVLYTPDSTLILRAVTIDLLYAETERLSRQQEADGSAKTLAPPGRARWGRGPHPGSLST